jgi:hypothetical protein
LELGESAFVRCLVKSTKRRVSAVYERYEKLEEQPFYRVSSSKIKVRVVE